MDTTRIYKDEEFILCEVVKNVGFSMWYSKDRENPVEFVKAAETNCLTHTHFTWCYIPGYIDIAFIDMLWDKSITKGELCTRDSRLYGLYPIYDIDKYNKKLDADELKRQEPEEVIFTNSLTNAMFGDGKISTHII